jgi:hypothetical protein
MTSRSTIVGLGGSPAIALQLKTLGMEVVRVTEKFSVDGSLHREAECEQAAERVATAG